VAKHSHDKSLRKPLDATSLSAGALRAGLQVAAKESFSADEAALYREKRPYLRHLTDGTVRLVAKEPPMWEYRLYFQALHEFVAKASAEVSGAARPILSMDLWEMIDWINDRFDEYQQLVVKINQLINARLQAALGPPGKNGDAAAIISVAKQVANVYRRCLEIRTDALSSRVPSGAEEIVREFGRICDQSLEEFQTYPSKSLETLLNALATADEDTEMVLRFEMTLKADNAPFSAALRRAKKRFSGR
jgi:hypothetical protein